MWTTQHFTQINRNIRFWLLLLASSLLGSCNFLPDGDYYRDLDQEGNPPYIEVELNFDTDTLYICNNEWISFHYTKNGDQVNWTRFIVDGAETSPNDEQHGALEPYWYFPGFLPGIHTLSLQLFTRSGTGSVADHVGAEGFLAQKDWVLKVVEDNEMGSSVDTSFQNGLLKISWSEYKGLNFENYKVYKYVQPTSLPDQLVATITDQHETSVVDPNYHGENSIYYVRVNDRYRGNSLQMEGPLPALSATNNAQGDIVLHWEKPPFWAALKGYRIMDDDISWTSAGFDPLYLIGDAREDSFVITDPYFAYNYNLWLQLDPKGTVYLENWSRPVSLATKVTVSAGIPSPKFAYGRAGIENCIYLGDYQKIDVFDTERNQVTETFHLPAFSNFEISAGNKYLTANLHGPNQLYFLDLKNPDNHKIIDFSGQVPYIEHIATVADNGTGIVLSGQNIILYDYIAEEIIAEGELAYSGLYQHFISAGGKYFCFKNYGGFEFFQLSGDQLAPMEEINKTGSTTVFADFLTDEQTKLVRLNDQKIEVIDCATQSIVRQWDVAAGDDTEIYHVDQATKQLFMREGENFVLLNTETGIRTLLARTHKSYELSWWGIKYNNGQILWQEGRRMDVRAKL